MTVEEKGSGIPLTEATQVGGAMFHSFKGARNAPRGERMAGAIEVRGENKSSTA